MTSTNGAVGVLMGSFVQAQNEMVNNVRTKAEIFISILYLGVCVVIYCFVFLTFGHKKSVGHLTVSRSRGLRLPN